MALQIDVGQALGQRWGLGKLFLQSTIMDIHQMQLRYDPRADRLLWQIRTRAGELFAVWLTRRLALRMWPPFERIVTQAVMPRAQQGHSTVVPEAQAMMSELARQRPLPSTDFQAPFDEAAVTRPLGSEPLLPDTLDLTPTPQLPGRGLSIRIREHAGRSLQLQLGDDMATALMRLMEQSLQSSDWLLAPVPSEARPGVAAGLSDKPPLAS
jgi:hypothetical protein